MKITSLAHEYWSKILSPGDTAIDATCGNGQDMLLLAQRLDGHGQLTGYDIQEKAIQKSQQLLKQLLSPELLKMVSWRHGSQAKFQEKSAKLIVYNLGYLPGGDKSITTQSETTLESLQAASEIVVVGGAISVTCYVGHEEGAREEAAVLDWAGGLSPNDWWCCHHRLVNRSKAPSLLWIQHVAQPELV